VGGDWLPPGSASWALRRGPVRRGPFVAGLPSRSWCAQCSVERRVADTSRTTITTGVPAGAPRAADCHNRRAQSNRGPLAAFERRHNATATTFDWRFTASDLDDLPRPHRRPRTKVDHGGRPTPTNFRRRPHRLPTARRSAKDVRKWLSRWIDCPDALSPASVRSSARCSRRPGWSRTSSPKSWMSGGRGLNNHRGGRKRARRRAAPPARPGLAHPPRPRRSMTLPLDDLAAQRPDVVRLMALGLAG
jgi:hypothetical protein